MSEIGILFAFPTVKITGLVVAALIRAEGAPGFLGALIGKYCITVVLSVLLLVNQYLLISCCLYSNNVFLSSVQRLSLFPSVPVPNKAHNLFSLSQAYTRAKQINITRFYSVEEVHRTAKKQMWGATHGCQLGGTQH